MTDEDFLKGQHKELTQQHYWSKLVYYGGHT
jgi:hypothetical protein